jgi:glycosyltransferase involved in cell wall biosynthesis
MKRAVHLTSVHPTFDVRIFRKECMSLLNNGYHVTLVAPHGKSENIEGIEVVNIGKPTNKVARILSSTVRMYVIARKLPADVFHFHDTELIPLGFMLAVTGRKVIYDMHENMPGFILTKEWIPKVLRKPAKWLFQSIERLTLNRFHVIFAESSYKAEYLWVKNSSIILNYPLADHLLKINAEKNSRPTVGYVGDVSISRGAISTLTALTMLKKQGLTIDWLCIGRIPEDLKTEIQTKSQAEGLNVELLGFMKSTEAHPLIAKVHIGLAVIDRIPNYTGSLSTKLFEYMALGMPLITSDFPLYKELIESINCGICVAPEKPEELAQAIQFLVENPAEAAAMGQRGRAAVMNGYNWKTEEAKLLGIYQSLESKA